MNSGEKINFRELLGFSKKELKNISVLPIGDFPLGHPSKLEWNLLLEKFYKIFGCKEGLILI